MQVAVWILLGLAAAVITNGIRDDDDTRHAVVTSVVGVCGALAGGLTSRLVGPNPDARPGSVAFAAFVGAVVALAIYVAVSATSGYHRRAT
jgi:uncharacterized membrane protein YeaQ/YmgE (transglycosylase-associated protein family)